MENVGVHQRPLDEVAENVLSVMKELKRHSSKSRQHNEAFIKRKQLLLRTLHRNLKELIELI